jgi:tRNA(Ile)-lysidine synthetase-like protein
MRINWPPPGRYILAVSGGADSMVLFDLFAAAAEARGYELIVAHFDHGLRAESGADRAFVQEAAQRYQLPFEHHEAGLGRGSEATARTARHTWLEQVRARHQAAAVVTAHHQDDLVETSLLNLAHGSGRRGLAPMSETRRGGQPGRVVRPLIGATRSQLRDYARTHAIGWREDSSNSDLSNPRNFLRHSLLAGATSDWRSRYLKLLSELAILNTKIAQSISGIASPAQVSPDKYSFGRAVFDELSLPEIEELIMHVALALRPGVELDRRIVMEVALFAKTASPHRRRALREGLEVRSYRDSISILAF